MTIVGVVGNVRQDSPASVPAPEIYMPLEQHPYHANEVQVVLRTAVDPDSVVPLVREKMHRLNATMALKFTTLDRMVSSTLETQRFRTWLFAAFAGLALLLAMAGVYGVIAYLAAQRTSEFGLRLALGATPRSLFGLVVSRAGWLALTGIPSGLVLAFAATRLIASVLPDVAPLGVDGYMAVAGLVALVVLAAAGMPGWTAARVDPMVALREE
jgi:ABC-type antimicrobial peptide transport system permease subunit